MIDGTDLLQDLVGRFDGRLRRYVSKYLEPADIDDALHDIYARLARQAMRIPPPSFNSTYVFKTADGVLRDLYRRRRVRDADRHVELTDDIPSDTPTPFDSARWRQNLDRLRAAILTLPRQERLVLMMHRIEGRKLTEIAESQRIPLRTVQQLLAQALARCRGKLKEDGWFEL
ncbi:MAG: RNA polymerase sigma factor [Caulobacter sp.]